ncbi:MAG: alpha-glucan family phosphorylase [Planctomycetales bacterium]|nr:alpha-glucan family phosphorylase [Planctomycetales bacterium]NIP68772.1 alpha-glucan family phosphorylase [Planctomycetales bacterium]
MTNQRQIAYFSMEIGCHPDMPTYAGGLGMLAGDTIRSAADLAVPLVAVTLVHRQGYFYQRLDESGWQHEQPANWRLEDHLTDTGTRALVTMEGRSVQLRVWQYEVQGDGGRTVPIYLLDADLDENTAWDRRLTDTLYGGDDHYRLCQEVILGIGGVRALRALGYDHLNRFHMNEGHPALLTLELLRERREAEGRSDISQEDLDAVRRQCVFTTHTPVPAGHDQFDLELVDRVLGNRQACGIHDPICHANRLNMTYLALSLSHYINGVAKRHADISRHMFADYAIDAITNGVHAATWVSPPLAALFDRHIPGWRQDNFSLRYALSIPHQEVWEAHQKAKQRLIDYVNRETNAGLGDHILTLGFGRRAAAYKRGDLIFEDLERIRQIARDVGQLQLVFAGKAHPQDEAGKQLVQRIVQLGRQLAPEIPIVYLPNYDMQLAGLMTAGVDVWLNTPQPPLEASGTSGMKAALNGVPSLSILDGWWIEGCIEGITGWGIGSDGQADGRGRDAASLYQQLATCVIPLYYQQRDRFIEIMCHAIALNGSFFNTQRMVQQYVLRAYFE